MTSSTEDAEKPSTSFCSIPPELQLMVIRRLRRHDAVACRLICRQMKSLVDSNRSALPRRKIEKIEISTDSDEINISVKSERRKRHKYTICVKDAKREKIKRLELDDDYMACDLNNLQFIDRLNMICRDGDISTLELYEVNLTNEVLESLGRCLLQNGTRVTTLDLAMCTFQSVSGDILENFLASIDTQQVRLRWMRCTSATLFTPKLINFLCSRRSLEIVNVTDHKGSTVIHPITVERLLGSGCSSFHLDNISKDSLVYFANKIGDGAEVERVHLETLEFPDFDILRSDLAIEVTTSGIAVDRRRKLKTCRA